VASVVAYVRALWRSMLVFLVVLAVTGGSLAGASVLGHNLRRRVPVVLRPTWHRVAPARAVDVAVSGRYVFIGGGTGLGAVIDEETGKRLVLTPPSGCLFDDGGSLHRSLLGGSWVVATCNPPPLGPGYELYSIPNRKWMSFNPDMTKMCALDAECATGDPDCPASYLAIGERWIEFVITCGYHSYPSTGALEQIKGGQVRGDPPAVTPGGNQILDLNSPTLTQTLCSPLRMPSAGTIVPDGRFALDEEFNNNTYLERCGSSLHRPIGDPGPRVTTISSHAVLWSPGVIRNEIVGLFLPSLQRLELRLPKPVASLCRHLGAFSYICIQGLALTTHTLYIVTSDSQVWSAQSPLPRAAAKNTTRR
jgi:hypothetical protein